MAQQPLPFESIPPYPKETNVGSVLARMVHGLGYRYHWASLDLREEDLNYRPSPQGASSYETLEHIYDLVEIVATTVEGNPTPRPSSTIPNTYPALREQTLQMLEAVGASLVEKGNEEIEAMEIVFLRDNKRFTFPIWHLINGPLSDAIYHTGQLVSFRRTTGNPIAKGVNVFIGKTKSE